MANDPYWNSVVLAMHMDDTGLTDVKGHTVTLNGNAARSATQSKFGGYSAYFDGTGDYLTVSQLITSIAFTIEAWVRVTAATEQAFFSQYSSNAGRASLYLNASGALEFFIGSATNLSIADATTLPTNAFVHIAVTREADGTTRLFRGGTLVASGSSTQALDATPCSIGGQYSTAYGLQRPMTGYIDDLRVTDGVARYTANFTPPTAAFPDRMPQLSGTVEDSTPDLVSRTVLAYRRSDGAFASADYSRSDDGTFVIDALDDTAHYAVVLPVSGDPHWSKVPISIPMSSSGFPDSKGHTVVNYGSTALVDGEGVWGGGAPEFTGAGTVLSVGDFPDLRLGTSVFTIEFWQKYTDYSGFTILMGKGAGNAGGWQLSSDNGDGNLSLCHGSSYTLMSYETGVTVDTDVWYHIAIVRTSTAVMLFRDGVMTNIRPNYNVDLSITDALFIGGKNSSGTNGWKGYMQDLRITKGLARYVRNFTPPPGPFPGAISGGTENALILDNIIPA